MELRYLRKAHLPLQRAFPYRVADPLAKPLRSLIAWHSKSTLPAPACRCTTLSRYRSRSWDTRDFEVDPHKKPPSRSFSGNSPARLIYKTTLDLRAYLLLYEKPQTLPRLTLAVRALLYGTYGRDVPLWDIYYANSWADARRLDGLSGPNLLRSYRENRFIAPFGQVYQAELRLMLLGERTSSVRTSSAASSLSPM